MRMDRKTAMQYAERIESLLPDLIRMAKNQETKRLAAYSLTLPQFFALSALEHHGSCMMGEMGEELGLTLGTVTGIIDRLTREELVERYADERDRRVVMVKLTQKGARLFDKIRHDRIETLSDRLQDLDKKDVDNFAELLVRVGEQLARNGI
jgi:DNA-binding MarR family transcriptional regulator